jgi:hypothetical protein
MIYSIHDTIKRKAKELFEEAGLDFSTFYQNIFCFSERGIRCAVIYDNAELEKTFVMVGFGITLHKKWELELFEVRDNGHYDAIDAMNMIDSYLIGHFSMGDALRKRAKEVAERKDNV